MQAIMTARNSFKIKNTLLVRI